MRIIGGDLKSRSITPPDNKLTTRPMPDRVKEALFNSLMTMGNLGGGNVLDLFCGTGNLGLEALSRGAEFCTFVDLDRKARDGLKQNISDLGLQDRSAVLAVDALMAGFASLVPAQPLWVIFCDPPYPLVQHEQSYDHMINVMAALAPLSEPEAAMMLRTQKTVDPPEIPGWILDTSRNHGSMKLSLFVRPETPES